jgi:hypothetical protein
MKSLGVASEEASFTAEALDKYVVVFSNPPVRNMDQDAGGPLWLMPAF